MNILRMYYKMQELEAENEDLRNKIRRLQDEKLLMNNRLRSIEDYIANYERKGHRV